MNNLEQQPALLTATDVWKRFRMGDEQVEILRGVGLEVPRGQWVTILGASGSGKSTLLHLLGGLDRPGSGTLRFNQQILTSMDGPALDRYRNRHIGFVFQFYHLLPELNVLENVLLTCMVGRSIREWWSVRKELRPYALDLLERLGLAHRLRHRPNKLSGGERQRVAIARALVNRPEVLLADEPTGNLDAEPGEQILQIFRTFHAAGQTIVMVTHDPRIANAADTRYTLVSGRLEHCPNKHEDASPESKALPV
jgi:ABC-type lipoprotein export system ATPase subunit